MSRDILDLETNAFKFWPSQLTEREHDTSIIPALIDSQEKFIGILYVADASPLAWKDAIQTTTGMSPNLFLKHLMVLSDIGGERLQRFRTEIHNFFPDNIMNYHWQDADHSYTFSSLDDCRTWTNARLNVTADALSNAAPLSSEMQDVAMLLIHGGSSTDPGLPDEIEEKCMIGSLIGRKPELDTFVRQRYIHVSRITGGATANTMGQLCQTYVREYLSRHLPDWNFTRQTIPGISHNAGRTDMSFDIVAESPSAKYCAIEVSFQVTTNSTIERKAGQAQARKNQLHRCNHKIAYVIDGAGNFQRRSALQTICQHSDCTVSFKDEELDSLIEYLQTLEE